LPPTAGGKVTDWPFVDWSVAAMKKTSCVSVLAIVTEPVSGEAPLPEDGNAF
jgi:hypothetical protein